MTTPSLRSRIRNGTLLMLAVVLILGGYALPHLYRLGGAIRETLYRNYVSIDAAQHMHSELRRLQLADRAGQGRVALPASSAAFMHWMDVENHIYTEVGEPELAHSIESNTLELFREIAAGQPQVDHDAGYDRLHGLLDDLIQMNRAAMFRADSRAMRLGMRLTYEFAAGLLVLIFTGAALSWGLSWTLSRPLTELAERLRGISRRDTHLRLGPQRLTELDTVAREFNEMAERLEQYEKLNVERLVYEKSKTEAIIESLEDGVVLIDSGGVVAHINEIAAIILGIDAADALGSIFDDLSSNHPHYLRIRDALRTSRKSASGAQRIEVELHVRGREHSYVLKPVPLRHPEGGALGTLLIMQDVTYLRDQDRARTNLVATLSHELRTPLTSLALSAELLGREHEGLEPRQRALLDAILEECARMKQLSDNLLSLARGEAAAIAVQRRPLDIGRLAEEVSERFALQAREKQVVLERRIEPVPQLNGDPVKLSWMVSNLIGNALRYTPSGGKIEIVARPRNHTVILEVADSGPGIAPEIRDYIFERFAQYAANGGGAGSAGLGLAIVRDIVEAHGGRIFVESNGDRGSRFVVELPAMTEA